VNVRAPTLTSGLRYARATPEFARIANLSDAVFAIAMTLLVLTLDTPEVPVGQVSSALVDQLPQLVAFGLAFALVANLWWQHHKMFALFEVVEPGMVGINLALLGAVALVPFPTSLVGSAPADRGAVVAFIAVFLVLSLLHLLLVVRARAVDAWGEVVTDEAFYWMVGQWVSGSVVLLVAAAATLWRPVIGLTVLAVTFVLGPVAARQHPFAKAGGGSNASRL
jgi:uncharacterized membrane protein